MKIFKSKETPWTWNNPSKNGIYAVLDLGIKRYIDEFSDASEVRHRMVDLIKVQKSKQRDRKHLGYWMTQTLWADFDDCNVGRYFHPLVNYCEGRNLLFYGPISNPRDLVIIEKRKECILEEIKAKQKQLEQLK